MHLTADGTKLLCEALRQHRLRNLDLSLNRIGDSGATYLAELLKNSKLNTLILRNVGIKASGGALLIEAVTRKGDGSSGSRCRHLDLDGNRFFNKEGKGTLFRDQLVACLRSTPLKKLVIQGDESLPMKAYNQFGLACAKSQNLEFVITKIG